MKISDKLKFMIKIPAVLTVLTVFGMLLHCQNVYAHDSGMTETSENIYNGITGFAASSNADFGPYMKRMQDKIKSNWAPPAVNLNAQIVIKYRILRDGTLDSYGISASSGSQELDNAAVDALRRSAPFEPLPASFEKNSVLVSFTFDYQKPANAANLPSPVNTSGYTASEPVQTTAPRKLQTLAISPLGDTQATTSAYNPQSTPVRKTQSYTPAAATTVPVAGTAAKQIPVQTTKTYAVKPVTYTNKQAVAVNTIPAAYTTANTVTVQPRVTNTASHIPVKVNSRTGTIAVGTPPAAGYQQTQTNNSSYKVQNKVAMATVPAIRQRTVTTRVPAIRQSETYTPSSEPSAVDDQLYTTGSALPEPAVNPRRTVNIDTFASPDQLSISVPLTSQSEQISSKQTVVNVQTPVNSEEINRIALPVTYDPEIEQVIVDEDDLPPIETPTFSTGINKVAIPQQRQRVKRVAPPPQNVQPVYVAAPPPQTYVPAKPVQVTPVYVPDFAAYMAKVQKKITKKWHPPFSDYSSKVVVNYIINKNGELGKYYIAESSGNSRMDVSATKALEKAAPFDPLPLGYDEDSVDVKFTFDYNVYKNKSEMKGIKEMEDGEDN